MDRKNYSSGAPWEPIMGYSRAVKVGSMIFVSGTTAMNEQGELVGENDIAAQTRQIILIIEKALKHYSADLSHVVRTRMFVVDASKWEAVGRVHGEFFKDIRPASTLVEISGLIDPRMLIEIEVDAVISE